MKDKKMTKNKRRKSVAGGVVKKTRSFIGRVNKKVDMAAKAFRKDWKKGQPKREKYKEELRNTVNKVLENSIKIRKNNMEKSTVLIVSVILLVLGVIGLVSSFSTFLMWAFVILGVIGLLWNWLNKGKDKNENNIKQ